MHTLFVYGTLLDPHLRNELIGRSATSYSNILPGFRRAGLNIVESEGDEVHGATFEVSDTEMEKLDRYEGVGVGLYKRIAVTLSDGSDAIAYQKVDPEVTIAQELSGRFE